jgi:hypothetical protein
MRRRVAACALAALTLVVAAPAADAGAQAGEIELLTPKKGEGIRPVFEWEPVDGASRYLLVVQDKRGRAYWSWQGSETEVPLGGGEKPRKPGAGGPRIAKGYKWIVSAFNPNGELLAISKLRPISP